MLLSVDAAALRRAAPYERLIPALAEALGEEIAVAPRALLHIGEHASDGFMGVMPSWLPGRYAGVKAVTSFAANRAHGRPSVSGAYILVDASDGSILAVMDGTVLTLLRTAAASALAADRLAGPDARTLLVCGTGALAPELVAAHRTVRRYDRVLVWGRDPARAEALAEEVGGEAAGDLAAAAQAADVVSCATGARSAFLRGEWLRPGTHLDLVGSFSPAMREADDAAILGARLFVDNREEAVQAGEIAGPISAGRLSADDIEADLAGLLRAPVARRPEERTVYKSAGLAALDLAMAVFVWTGLQATGST